MKNNLLALILGVFIFIEVFFTGTAQAEDVLLATCEVISQEDQVVYTFEVLRDEGWKTRIILKDPLRLLSPDETVELHELGQILEGGSYVPAGNARFHGNIHHVSIIPILRKEIFGTSGVMEVAFQSKHEELPKVRLRFQCEGFF